MPRGLWLPPQRDDSNGVNAVIIFASEVRYLLSGSPRQVVVSGLFAIAFAHQMWAGTGTGYAMLLAAAFALLLGVYAVRGTRIRLRQRAEREAARTIAGSTANIAAPGEEHESPRQHAA